MINGKDREKVTKRARSDVEAILKRYIDRYNNILYNTQISYDMFSLSHPKIEKTVSRYTKRIENELYNMCISRSLYKLDKEEDKDDIIAYINRDRDGMTLSESIREYVGVLNDEIEAYIESSLFFDVSVPYALGILKRNAQNAYKTDFIRKAYKEIDKPKSNIIKSKGITVKKGQYKTSSANLKRAISYIVIEALTDRQLHYFERIGANGYEVHRGSSYPCDYCDSFLGYHPMSDTESLPPQHGNCYCYITPSFEKL